MNLDPLIDAAKIAVSSAITLGAPPDVVAGHIKNLADLSALHSADVPNVNDVTKRLVWLETQVSLLTGDASRPYQKSSLRRLG
jgi:hypothetical protein